MPGAAAPEEALPPKPRPGRRREPRSALRTAARLALPAVLLAVLSGCGSVPDGEREGDEPQGFVRAAGRGLVVDGEPTRLRAVNFTNRYDAETRITDLLSSAHPSARDYAQVEDMGFNSVRFVLRGEWLAQDEEAFWTWLDRNVAWARDAGVRLVLDLHVPVGGRWLDPGNESTTFEMWSDPAVRDRTVEFWREVASRYHDEPAVAAYDLLNEPVTTDTDGQQWRSLAQELVDTIRAVDDNHLLIAGGVYGVEGRFDPEGQERHFLVDDENVMYDFHFYEPYPYTHQYAPWVDPARDGGRYPDPVRLVATAPPEVSEADVVATSSLPEGTSGWTRYDSGVVTVEDPSAVAALPQFVVEGGMDGTARVDGVTVTEYGPDGTVLREVLDDPMDRSSTGSWYGWGDDDGADPSVRLEREPSGRQDDGSLSVGGSVRSGAGWNNSEHLFRVVPGHRYRVQGYMRGDDVVLTGGERSRVRLELEVYTEVPGAPGGGFLARDKDYLEHAMSRHLRFGAEHGVPMSVMEFGAVRQTFEMPGKGGDRWVGDVLGLLAEHDLSFGYWEYHDPDMGIFVDEGGAPDEPNEVLLDVLRRELHEESP